jgi:hypothetical protein
LPKLSKIKKEALRVMRLFNHGKAFISALFSLLSQTEVINNKNKTG